MLSAIVRRRLLLLRLPNHRPCPPSSLTLSTTAAAAADDDIPKPTKTPTQESVLYVLKQLGRKPPKALEFFNHVATNYPGFAPGPAAHSLLLRIIAADKTLLPELWRLLNSMDTAGCPLDRGTYLTLLHLFNHQNLSNEATAIVEFYKRKTKESADDAQLQSAVKLICSEDAWGGELEKNLEEISLPLSENSVVKLLGLEEIQDSPLKALAFFRWAAARSPDYKHGSIAYNALARVLVREDTINEFWGLIEEMKGEGVELDIDTYVKSVRKLIKAKRMEDAVKLYELMMDGPYKPSIDDCGFILRQISLAEAPDLGLVSRVVSKYEATGHSLSKVVYDGMHRAVTKNGNFDEAEDIVKRMLKAGFEPDNVTYSQLVHGLCKAKRLEEARKVLDDMEEKGCVPDLKTWTMLIQGHCQAGEVDMALGCLTKMLGKGIEADADIVDVMLKALCGEKRVDGAYTLFIEMADKVRVRPWQATYKYLIQELLNEKKFEEAVKVLGLMKSHKYPPFPDPFPSYIAKYGTVEDALEFLKTLSVKTYPSTASYKHLFEAFFKEGRYTEAQDLLFKCPPHVRKNADICKLFGSIKA